jgi:hypothetical protein
MGLPLFEAPKNGERSWTAANRESCESFTKACKSSAYSLQASSDTRVPILSDRRGIAIRGACQDMDNWSTTASSPPSTDQISSKEPLNHFLTRVSYTPRPALTTVVRGTQPEAAGIEMLLQASSDLDDTDDSDYVDSGEWPSGTRVREINFAY